MLAKGSGSSGLLKTLGMKSGTARMFGQSPAHPGFVHQATAAKGVAAAEAGGTSGLFNFLGGLLRGNSSGAGAAGGGKEAGSDALLHGAQNLLGNDTLNALGAAVFPFILVRPVHL